MPWKTASRLVIWIDIDSIWLERGVKVVALDIRIGPFHCAGVTSFDSCDLKILTKLMDLSFFEEEMSIHGVCWSRPSWPRCCRHDFVPFCGDENGGLRGVVANSTVEELS
jgi:hypothetical protein